MTSIKHIFYATYIVFSAIAFASDQPLRKKQRTQHQPFAYVEWSAYLLNAYTQNDLETLSTELRETNSTQRKRFLQENQIVGKYNAPLLAHACRDKKIRIARLILSVDVNTTVSCFDRVKKTTASALYYAVQYGEFELVKTLLEHSADVNQGILTQIDGHDVLSKTPLFEATQQGRLDIVKILIHYKALPLGQQSLSQSIDHVSGIPNIRIPLIFAIPYQNFSDLSSSEQGNFIDIVSLLLRNFPSLLNDTCVLPKDHWLTNTTLFHAKPSTRYIIPIIPVLVYFEQLVLIKTLIATRHVSPDCMEIQLFTDEDSGQLTCLEHPLGQLATRCLAESQRCAREDEEQLILQLDQQEASKDLSILRLTTTVEQTDPFYIQSYELCIVLKQHGFPISFCYQKNGKKIDIGTKKELASLRYRVNLIETILEFKKLQEKLRQKKMSLTTFLVRNSRKNK